MNAPIAVGPEDVRAAARRIEGLVVRTPLIRAEALDAAAGAAVYLKPECLQTGGSFKLRGASNRIARLNDAERRAGVAAWSSGNHAGAVALAARRAGVPAVIVMPEDAPAAKRRRTEAEGAEIILYDRERQDREAIARRVAAERGLALAPSYDHPDVIAGQGTAGLEIMEDAIRAGVRPDRILVCCGGAGLVAGIGAAAAGFSEDGRRVQVTAVEAETHAGLNASLQAGRVTAVAPERRSVCDALLATAPGHHPFATILAHGVDAVTVDDAEALKAVAYAASELKLVLEPGGAVALAALLAGRAHRPGETVVVVLSGGNVDPETHAAAWRG